MAEISIYKRINPFVETKLFKFVLDYVLEVFAGPTELDQKRLKWLTNKLLKLEPGNALLIDFKFVRNYKYHCKLFAMLNFAFENWDVEHVAYKNFDRFRADIFILAGHYDQVYDIDGNVELQAKSINYGALDDAEFDEVYNACANVILQHVLKRYKDRSELDEVVAEALGFAR